MGKKILIVLTSHGTLGDSELKTGWYLPELAHPLKVLFDAGYTDLVEIVSPKGGLAPVDPQSAEVFKDDPTCQWLYNNSHAQNLINHTKKASDIAFSDYCAVVYPGGHGPMFDLAFDVEIAKITSNVFSDGGLVAACCHGPAGLVPVKDKSGNSIVHGRKITCFTNSEETAIEMTSLVPFALETKLKELGGKFSSADDFQEHVLVDGRLITGQNSQSSSAFSLAVLAQVKQLLAADTSGGKEVKKRKSCKKHSIPNSTLSTILKDIEKLQKARDDSKFRPATKETKLCSHEGLEDAVFAWFRQAMAMNVPLSGPVVIGKAEAIAQLMNFK
ncbi:thiamine biosynthesis protein ThiJ [Elysia marginata]|uniref:Thiamine biosynthesis protein ThiJ n=1 Tax=Elysia marginata TaxID=1093978 RepID=A0AAV4HYE6_9GAST|nr:thiamine biosynthesis protein ThiJ [Elysia marginata]